MPGEAPDALAARLLQLLDDGAFPKRCQNMARALAKRLSAPLRLSIIGPCGAGKSRILNLIAGTDIVAPGALLPPLTLRYTDEWQTTHTDASNNRSHYKGNQIARAAAAGAVLIEVGGPIEGLRSLELLEVDLPEPEHEQRAALNWVARRSDICLWCNSDPTENDFDLWAEMPDRIKDHAWLINTHTETEAVADALVESAIGAEQLSRSIALNISDPESCAAFLSELEAHCRHGRKAECEAAETLIARYAPRDEVASTATGVPELDPMTSANLLKPIADVLPGLQASNLENPNEILGLCHSAIEEMSMAVESQTSLPEDKVSAIEEAYDFITLLQLEETTSAALDGLSLLAQIKDELSAPQAA